MYSTRVSPNANQRPRYACVFMCVCLRTCMCTRRAEDIRILSLYLELYCCESIMAPKPVYWNAFRGQPGLHCKFQANRATTVWSCLGFLVWTWCLTIIILGLGRQSRKTTSARPDNMVNSRSNWASHETLSTHTHSQSFLKSILVVHACNPSIWEDSESKSCLDYIGKPSKNTKCNPAPRQTMCVCVACLSLCA